eukprot:Skav223621  [mRNA]  locus=scaffold3504:19879:20570:- [translate_table: standard]
MAEKQYEKIAEAAMADLEGRGETGMDAPTKRCESLRWCGMCWPVEWFKEDLWGVPVGLELLVDGWSANRLLIGW